MNEIIVAKASGEELRSALYAEYDFETGDDKKSTFLVTFLKDEWESIPDGGRLYIPQTEFGGLYKKTEVVSKYGTVAAGGFTWRGLMHYKIISPPSGQDYAVDSGELNAIVGARVSAAFPNLMVGSNATTEVTVTYQHKRYCTLYDGLKEMLASVGYRMRLTYNQELAKVVVDAVPIVDYSSEIEYSSDMNAHYRMTLDYMGVNHLICLGAGELKNRIVIHLYVDRQGRISTTQTLFGEDEICSIYDYKGAAYDELMKSGIENLQRDINRSKFSIELDTVKEVAIGDIVGSRDYTTGYTVKAPITTKVTKFREGVEKTEYKLSDMVKVEQSPVIISITAILSLGTHKVYTTDNINSLKNYLTVTATYSNATQYIVDNYTLVGNISTAGVRTLTVEYSGKATTISVIVSENTTGILYEWDFTQGLTDTRQLHTAELECIAESTLPYVSGDGLHFDKQGQVVTLLSPNDFPVSYLAGKTIQIDVASFVPGQQWESSHTRFITIAKTPSGGWENGLVYRGNNTVGWSIYAGSNGWGTPFGTLARNGISGHTVSLYFDTSLKAKLYIDSVLIGTQNVALASGLSGLAIGSKALETVGGSFFAAVVTGARIYNGETR